MAAWRGFRAALTPMLGVNVQSTAAALPAYLLWYKPSKASQWPRPHRPPRATGKPCLLPGRLALCLVARCNAKRRSQPSSSCRPPPLPPLPLPTWPAPLHLLCPQADAGGRFQHPGRQRGPGAGAVEQAVCSAGASASAGHRRRWAGSLGNHVPPGAGATTDLSRGLRNH